MATNRDLLKEAIADAKAVKETAIANAKAALEEAFTPYLKEKLSAKLQEMDLEEDELEAVEDAQSEVDSMMEEKESMDEISLDELLAELEGEEMEESIFEAKGEEEEESEEEESEEEMSIEDMDEDDLKSFIEDVIKDMVAAGELEAGHEGMENEEGAEEIGTEEEVDAEEEIDEVVDLDELLAEEELDEEIGLDELLAELEGEEIYEEEAKDEMKEELDEAYATIKTLQSELNEINLLNAKLLYTNKIFRNKSLTESQKVKVLTAFDKATSKKEAQLVYETLLENLKTSVKKSPIQESLGSASKALGTAKSKPIIEDDAFSRMRELAFGNKK
jgi:Arc/MetJ family transcription regulator